METMTSSSYDFKLKSTSFDQESKSFDRDTRPYDRESPVHFDPALSVKFVPQSSFRKAQENVQVITESIWFQGTVMIVIFINSIMLMFEVNNFYPSLISVYPVFDLFCLGVYTIEFFLKVFAQPVGYWRLWANRFDFFVLITAFIQVIVDEFLSDGNQGQKAFTGVLPILRTLRATRALRAMRAVSFVRGLQVILIALIDTTKKSFINVMLILIFTMFIFAIFGHYMFGYIGGDQENWGNLGVALLTLFSFATVDGWFDLQLEMDERTSEASRIFTILFIIVGHFIIFNIFISVNIENIQQANESFHEQLVSEKEAALARKKETIYLQQHEDIKKLEKRQRDAECSNFYEMVEPFQLSLRSDDFTTLEDVVTNMDWLDIYLETLEHIDEHSRTIRQHHHELANIFTESVGLEINKRLGN